MALLDDVEPILARGVIRFIGTCEHCESVIPVLGAPGKGRPLDTFPDNYFCRGHAVR